jgi:hypothetical protein
LDEFEEIKVNLIAHNQAKDVVIDHQRGNLRKMLGVIMMHREVFEPLSTINYEQIQREISQDV